MRRDEAEHQHDGCERVADHVVGEAQAAEIGHRGHGRAPDRRPQHHEHRGGDEGARADEDESHADEPRLPPGPEAPHAIGAAQGDPEALDPVGGDEKRQHDADRQHVPPRDQHLVGLPRQGAGHALGPEVEEQMDDMGRDAPCSEEGRERRDADQERKQRDHQRERHMARHGQAVVARKAPAGIGDGRKDGSGAEKEGSEAHRRSGGRDRQIERGGRSCAIRPLDAIRSPG